MKNKKLIIILAIVVGILLLAGSIFLIIKLLNPRIPLDNFSLKNTSWGDSELSEMVFTDDRVNWYKSETDYANNYYAGSYKLYVGKEAVDYLTTELASYGITKVELTGIFMRNEKYSESNFIVIDINYDFTVIDGVTGHPTKSHTPYYGFVLKDGTYLDITNMNTGTYLGFTKK